MARSVSVIIPAFGRQRQLQAAIQSVSRQLADGDEVLVVDDGSDPPLSIDFGDERSPANLRLLRLAQNSGPAAARNFGIEHARSELIAFLDSDDHWLNGKLAAQRAAIERHGHELVAVVCGWQERLNGEVFRTRLPRFGKARSDFFAGCWFCPGSTLLIDKTAYERCGLYDESLRRLEDFEWFLRFALAGGRLVVVNTIGASVARGGNSRPAVVEAAARRILELHSNAASGAERSDLLGYLDLERSAAFRNASDTVNTLRYLLRSLWHRPRLKTQLREWWMPDVSMERPPGDEI